ncbi:DUF7146 domain-containing protein [Sphingobium sp. LSP13-1-1.1]|uniref:DUF7146 domain-containing protein n=1 Tax=Sphingobium sp. LSP13-1-1.1 TaxID=3135234 RepID=UPI00343AFF6B
MSAPGRIYAIDVREIEQLLRADAERLAWELLPACRRDGHYLVIGSLAGEPGQSLKINVDGPNRGMWTDFSQSSGSGFLGGDCLHLIRLVLFNGEMGEAIKWAKSWLKIDDLDPARLDIRRRDARAAAEASALKDREVKEQKRRRAVALWMGSAPIGGTPAEYYLRGRGITVEALGKWPGSLRFHPEVYNKDEQVKMPAMVAGMFTPDGRHVATHRTYLRWDPARGWVKIDSPNAKMVLGACGGSFIPLRKGASGKSMADMPADEPVYIAEGIEDALTVAIAKPDLRIVAGYSLPNIGSIVWPEHVRTMVLLADRDTKPKAIDALERVIARQQARGMHVKRVLPPIGFKDFNEWLQRGGAGERAA